MNTLRIATLNCLNLALPGRRIYDGVPAYSPDEYIARTQWLAQMLDRLGADLVLLQEVFHERALLDVVRQTANQGRGLSCAAPFADDANGRPRVAMVWRAPLAPRLDSIVTLPIAPVAIADRAPHGEFSRPVLRAVVPLAPVGGGAAHLTVLNVHLKSRRPEFVAGDDPVDPVVHARAQLRALTMRAAEAVGLRQLVVAARRPSRAALLVAGDFNDTLDAVTTRLAADSATGHEHPLADDVARLADLALYDAVLALRSPVVGSPGERAHSILRNGVGERIDHVLVSDDFLPGSATGLATVTAVEWLTDHLQERLRPGPLGRIYSDHGAVCVTLQLAS